MDGWIDGLTGRNRKASVVLETTINAAETAFGPLTHLSKFAASTHVVWSICGRLPLEADLPIRVHIMSCCSFTSGETELFHFTIRRLPYCQRPCTVLRIPYTYVYFRKIKLNLASYGTFTNQVCKFNYDGRCYFRFACVFQELQRSVYCLGKHFCFVCEFLM